MPDALPPEQPYEPTKAQMLNHAGAQLFGQGQLEPARLHFLAALSLEPNDHHTVQNLGAVLRQMGHYEAAESLSRRSVILSGNSPYCRSNLGVSQLGLRKYHEAEATLKAVLKDLPASAPSWHNFGLVEYMLGHYSEAMKAFDKCLGIEPMNVQCQSDRALNFLAMGEIERGLEAYEVRWQILRQSDIWKMPVTEWRGEDIKGKRLLLHHEQGFGDSLMLVRFVKDLQAQYDPKITLAVPPELGTLFRNSLGSEVGVADWKDPDLLAAAELFAYHCPLLSLMRYVGIKKPDDIDNRPYLRAVPTGPVKLPAAKFRIGICWASGNHGPQLMERRRVVSLTEFLPLTELRDAAVVSLQKGDNARDLERCGMEGLVYDTSYRLDSFADTAEIIHCLDLVITVDSAVAHLAGAMGKPVIMLSPFTRCWRWWSNSSGWPWYGNMRVFHQASDGSWHGAMQRAISTARGDMNRYILYT